MPCVRGSNARRYGASRSPSQSLSSRPTATAATGLSTLVEYESTLLVTVLMTWTWPLPSSTPNTNERPATQNATCASERSLPIVLTSPVSMSSVPTRLVSSMNQTREPLVAIRWGFKPDGSETLYRPTAIGLAPSKTLGDAATTTADGFGDFVGWGDAVGEAVGETEVDALGEESVVAADAGGAELALAAIAGT